MVLETAVGMRLKGKVERKKGKVPAFPRHPSLVTRHRGY
jgi:hypothetical protein